MGPPAREDGAHRPRDARIRVRGHLIRYRELGAGPPVLLVHGLGGAARWWGPTAPALARSHRVIVPEMPGFGYGFGTAPLRLDELPDLLGALLARLGVARASLVGHSLGALACGGLAGRAPELVQRLAMIAPPVRLAGRSLLANALPAIRTLLRLPPAAAATVVSDIVAHSPVALARAAGELLVAEHAADLARIRAPTLLLWGERDVLVPASGARELAGMIRGARVRLIPGAGHVPLLDRPDEVARELEAFLAASGPVRRCRGGTRAG